MDQSIKLFDITRNKVECLITLKHESHIDCLSLSPDNSLLAVGGQNSDIYIWSLKHQTLLRSFYTPSASMQNISDTHQDADPNIKGVFDINWSTDGTVIAAGIYKSVVMLDMRKILTNSGPDN